MRMTPEEMIKTLRICGNHPSLIKLTCADCPYVDRCEADKGGASLLLMAAELIEALTGGGGAGHE